MSAERTAAEVWTIGGVLAWTTQHFRDKGIDCPRLDAELLLAAVLRQGRLYLYTHYDQPLTPAERDAFRDLVQRRARREPVAYLLGKREFYGLDLMVTKDVLVPRPETEHLVDAVRSWLEARGLVRPRIADVGTGSGAIALSLATHAPEAEIVATDISPAALAVARGNAEKLGLSARVRFLEGDLVAPLAGLPPFDVVAANLPYVPERDRSGLMPEVRDHEPAVALFGGADGLDLVRCLIDAAPAHLGRPALLALEIGAGQWTAVEESLRGSGVYTRVRAVADLQEHRRVALAERD